MDFDPERQVFELSERETTLLGIHPAWSVCPQERAPQLYSYVLHQSAMTFDTPRWPIRRYRAEIRRQVAARKVAESILEQLEPFIEGQCGTSNDLE